MEVRRFSAWLIVAAFVVPLVAIGGVGCKKKGPKVETGGGGPGRRGEQRDPAPFAGRREFRAAHESSLD